nr:MAG TPA: hypothetical protein [Caudoviricetes sp.]
MVSGFCNISKIVILFNYVADSDSLAVCLFNLCKRQPAARQPGRFAAGGVVVGGLRSPGFVVVPSPLPEKRGRPCGSGIALYRAHRPKVNHPRKVREKWNTTKKKPG